MSLIGSEVDCSESTPEISRSSQGKDVPRWLTPIDDDIDGHASMTPPRPAEQLFVNLQTTVISASLLASHMHRMNRTSSRTSTNTVATDDFATAVESQEALEQSDEIDSVDFPFHSDIFHFSQSPIPEETSMATSTTPTKTAPGKTADPAEKVYDTAKGVWAWGKGVFFISPFLGVTEAVAGKVVEMAGSNLEQVDGALKGHLHGLDEGLLNPAIAKLVEALVAATGKTEEFLKPIIATALKPFGMIKNHPEPELTA